MVGIETDFDPARIFVLWRSEPETSMGGQPHTNFPSLNFSYLRRFFFGVSSSRCDIDYRGGSVGADPITKI
jgi:hypothetical protein